MEKQKDLEYYLNLPYTILTEKDEDDEGEYWFAAVKELPGCVIHGNTEEEARMRMKDLLKKFISFSLECGIPVEEPGNE